MSILVCNEPLLCFYPATLWIKHSGSSKLSAPSLKTHSNKHVNEQIAAAQVREKVTQFLHEGWVFLTAGEGSANDNFVNAIIFIIESAGGIANLGNLLWIVIRIHSRGYLNDPKKNVSDALAVGVGKCHPPHSSAATEK